MASMLILTVDAPDGKWRALFWILATLERECIVAKLRLNWVKKKFRAGGAKTIGNCLLQGMPKKDASSPTRR